MNDNFEILYIIKNKKREIWGRKKLKNMDLKSLENLYATLEDVLKNEKKADVFLLKDMGQIHVELSEELSDEQMRRIADDIEREIGEG